MGVLGLDQQEYKDDNLFKRLFWPSDNPSETDTLGQQGFWLCLVIGLVSTVVLTVQGQWLVALLNLLFFLLGGMGVREHSVVAAVLVAVVKVVDVIASLAMGMPPGALALITTGLLLANIRGTYIASRWKQHYGAEVMPERMNTTFSDKLVDQMPARVWPRGRFVFYGVSVLYILLLVVGTAMLVLYPKPRVPQPISAELPATPQSR